MKKIIALFMTVILVLSFTPVFADEDFDPSLDPTGDKQNTLDDDLLPNRYIPSEEYTAIKDRASGGGIIGSFEGCEQIYLDNKDLLNLTIPERMNRVNRLATNAGTLKINAAESGGILSADISGSMDYVEYAVLNMTETYNALTSGPVTDGSLTFEFTKDAETAELTIPQAVVAIAMEKNIPSLTVRTTTVGILLPLSSLASFPDASDIKVEINAKKGNTLSQQIASLTGDNMVYSFKLSDGSRSYTAPEASKYMLYDDGKGALSITDIFPFIQDDEGKVEKTTPKGLATERDVATFGMDGQSFYTVIRSENPVDPTDNTNNDDDSNDNNNTPSTPGTNTTDTPDYNDDGTIQNPEPSDEVVFTDLPADHWGKPFIEKLVKAGVLSGMGDGTFQPEGEVTREQFAKMLVEAFDLLDESAECSFNDVPNGEWYYEYVASAYKAGIVFGIEDNLFGAWQNIKRMDMAVMAVRAIETLGKEINPVSEAVAFSDDEFIEDYAKDAVTKMQRANIIQGVGGNMFSPNEPATRAAAAKIICMLMESVEILH